MNRGRSAPAQREGLPIPGIVPRWDAPTPVRAFVTTRGGGVSAGAFGREGGAPGGMNLGTRCGDDPDAVCANRARLASLLPSQPVWLEQVHGTAVHRVSTNALPAVEPRADASVTSLHGVVLAILTADCLPVLFADSSGTAIGAAHAGWRGLAAGVLERTVEAVRDCAGADADILAWLGPAIGPAAFEVGDEVRARFCDEDRACAIAFTAGAGNGKWMADLYALARIRLARVNVLRITGGGRCTYAEQAEFHSYRRDRVCGRMASLIWRESR